MAAAGYWRTCVIVILAVNVAPMTPEPQPQLPADVSGGTPPDVSGGTPPESSTVSNDVQNTQAPVINEEQQSSSSEEIGPDDHDGPGGPDGPSPDNVYDTFSRTMEQDLRHFIFKKMLYEKLIRPKGNVIVRASLRPQRINTLDIEEQTMTITAYLFLSWRDERMNCENLTRYDDDTVKLQRSVPDIFTSELDIWRPSINVENSVLDMSTISDPDVPMRVRATGIVEWSPAGIYRVQCNCDVTFYPFDTQICSLILSTRGYTHSEIALAFAHKPLDMQSYQENGEWELLGYTTEAKSRVLDTENYSSLTISFRMRRRPVYVFISIILPTVLLSFLSAFVFKLPAESGEKIGYSLTVLLSYAVYLSIITSHTPAASLTVSILSVYTVVVLILGVIAVVLAIIVLDCYHKNPDENIPPWFRKCILGCLIPMTAWRRPGRRVSKKESQVSVAPWDDDVSTLSLYDCSQAVIEKSDCEKVREPPMTRAAWTDMSLTWVNVSRILDRFFLRLYLCTLFVITGFVIIVFSVGYFGL